MFVIRTTGGWVIIDFVHESFGSRVVFAPKARYRVADEVSRLSARRVLVIAARAMKPHADVLIDQLGPAVSARIDGVTQHVPAEAAREAVLTAGSLDVDLVVCIGGGSATGLAKAVARDTGRRPILAIPTTYAGSEMTPIWGTTEGGRKATGRDSRVLPRVVVYDPELTLGLPASMSGASGMNALAHCVEGLYAADASPVTVLLAEEGIRALARSLPLVIEHPDDLMARSTALYGAWLAGWTLGTVRMGIHHTICHVLGGTFGLPHAGTHSAVLPHAAGVQRSRGARGHGHAGPVSVHRRSCRRRCGISRATSGPRRRLLSLGFRREDAAAAAAMVVEANPLNPRPVTKEEVEQLLLARPRRNSAHMTQGGGQP